MNNCAFLVIIMKLGRMAYYVILIKIGYESKQNSPYLLFGGHFSKWPPVVSQNFQIIEVTCNNAHVVLFCQMIDTTANNFIY